MTLENDLDGASRVAFNLLKSRLDSEYQLRQLAEAAAAAARSTLIELGQDLFGDFKEVHKVQLPTMSEEDIARLIYRRVQQKIAEQVAFAVKQAAASKATLPQAPVIVVRDEPVRALPAAIAPAVPPLPPEPLEMDEPAILPGPASAASDADDKAEDGDVALELADFVPYTSEFVPAAPATTWPNWFTEWFEPRRGNVAKTFTVLQILGRTGDPYLTRVMQTAGQLLNLRGGGIYRSADQLEEMGLIQREEVLWKRIKPHLVALTPRGMEAYRLLFGNDPAPQTLQAMLARHKSPNHVYLILETQRHLEAAGFTVNALPPALATSQGRYEPDLLAHLDGETVYIEAEVKTHKDLRLGGPRQEKWSRYWDVTAGELYLAVVDGPGQKSLLSELRYWAQQLRLRGDIWFLQAGEREFAAHGWDVWEHSTLG